MERQSYRNKETVHKSNSDPGAIGTTVSSSPSSSPSPSASSSSTAIATAAATAASTFASTSSLCRRHRSTGSGHPHAHVPRKCVLTLDGYSYVIVASPPDKCAVSDQQKMAISTSTATATATTTATAATAAAAGERLKYGGQSSSIVASSVSQVQTAAAGAHNGQLSKQGSLTIVRRSSTKKSPPPGKYFRRGTSVTIADDDAVLDEINLSIDNLPPVDTPDACDKAALRLRCLLRQLQKGEISAELLQKNLRYAAKVLEAVFIDETKGSRQQYTLERDQIVRDRDQEYQDHDGDHDHAKASSHTAPSVHAAAAASAAAVSHHQQQQQQRRLRTPIWARRLVDEDDELSEVQPDAVPPEVREWLASTFTRQLATTRRRTDEKPKFRSVAHAIRAGIFVDRIYRKVTNAALMQFPTEVVRVLKTLDEWSFDIFDLSDASCNQPLKYLGYDLLNRYGMFHKFKVPPAVVEYFLSRIEEGYYKFKNPYHNNLHAADVAQCIHWMLYKTGLMNWLTDLEIFATLVAAIVHDYEHTGTTNNFHVMSGSDTALLYNDRAVLENHHISATFRLMKEDECNILQHLSREEYREFRTLVIDMVLATDMSFHFQQLKNMRNLLTLAEPFMDKSKALSLVLHCCDISHPAKRWDLHRQWTARLLEEFFRQGDKERDLGLPFSPLCDRNNTLVAESQIGFIDFIVEPSLAVCGDMLEIIVNALHSPSATSTSTAVAATQAHITSSGSSQESTSMDSSSSDGDSNRIQIKKPWIQCLVDNKRRWKEQATKEAAARAVDYPMEECSPQDQLEDITERIEDR